MLKLMEKGQLQRLLGVKDAVIMGLGSMMGTGAFVSLGIAVGVTGEFFFLSLFLAGFLATLNGLSTAQLAGKYPVSGGAYEYARGEISPFVGFLAGWLFLVAKAASASTAALGAISSLTAMLGISLARQQTGMLAALLVLIVGGFVCFGLKRTRMANRFLVVLVLLAFVAFGFVCLISPSVDYVGGISKAQPGLREVFYGAALLFVSFTGYGRVATLGEEVVNPKRTIPIAVVMSLVVAFGFYFWIALCSIHVVGEVGYSELALGSYAPLQDIAAMLGHEWLLILLVCAALAAMLGVLLNLILGLSRVTLAMARHRDLPEFFEWIAPNGEPIRASLLVTAVIMFFCLTENLENSWELSALTVLLYYSITNIAALKLKTRERFLSSYYSLMGLIGCLSLAFFVDGLSLLKGALVLAVGCIWYFVRRKYYV